MHVDRGRVIRYVAVCAVLVLIIALLFPVFDGLSLAGVVNEKTYLLILQDNTEIRPTGGLMGYIGLVTLHNGNVKDLSLYYAGDAWTGSVVNMSGPESLIKFFNESTIRFYDSNVQYDFGSSAPVMLSDLYNLTGKKADGIIAIDFTGLAAILRITGPINASGCVMTSRNVADRIHYYSGIAEGGHKAYLTSLMSSLVRSLVQTVRDASFPVKLDLINALRNMNTERHFFFYVPGDALTESLTGVVARPSTDFISVVDMNLGSGKSDFGVHRSIDYRVQLLANGSAASTLTVTYNNTCFWRYDVFSTVLVPPGAELLNVTTSAQNLRGPVTTRGADFTAFSVSVRVSNSSIGTITYQYTLPNVVRFSGDEGRYALSVLKQAVQINCP